MVKGDYKLSGVVIAKQVGSIHFSHFPILLTVYVRLESLQMSTLIRFRRCVLQDIFQTISLGPTAIAWCTQLY